MKVLSKIWFILVAFSLGYSGQTPLTPRAALSLTYPLTITPSPDGKRVAMVIREPNWEESRWEYHLWWITPDQPMPRRITFSDGDEYQPQWSPNGQWLTFVSDRSGEIHSTGERDQRPQLWALPVDGGEARQWTFFSQGIQDYRWLPNGQKVVIIAELPLPDSLRKRQKRLQQLKFDAVVRDSATTRLGVYLLNVNTLHTRLLAEVDAGFREFDISPDGQWLVYETNYTGKYDDEQKFDLWVLNLSTGETVQLTDYPGPEYAPQFSADGKSIFYINQTTPDVEFAEWDVARIPFIQQWVPLNQVDTLTHDLDRSVQAFQVLPSGKGLLLQVADGLSTPLMQFAYKRNHRRYQIIGDRAANYANIQVTPAGLVFALKETAVTLPEIVTISRKTERVLTRFSQQLQAFTLGRQQPFRWKSVDGQTIEGVLILPVNFDPKKQYPLVVTIHGGPYGRFRNVFRQAYYHQVYANKGYVLLAPNPRGSAGYDDAFGKAIWYRNGGHMGGIDYLDIMAGVDAVIQQGFVDSTRMGVIGGSYGGYMTNWIISQTRRFAAAVSQFGIFSLFTDWSNSWQPSWEKMYLGIYYWEHPINEEHPYVAYSPAFHVTNIHTPVLILHGEKDRYTNLANSQEMYQALRTLGREVKFVVYPREGHGLGREPNHRLDVLQRSLRWFEQHLKK